MTPEFRAAGGSQLAVALNSPARAITTRQEETTDTVHEPYICIIRVISFAGKMYVLLRNGSLRYVLRDLNVFDDYPFNTVYLSYDAVLLQCKSRLETD